MKKLMQQIVTMVIIAILATSCRKNDKLEDQLTSFDALEAKHVSKEQKFFINAATGATINLSSGARITFPPNFAKKANGELASGQIAILARESYKKNTWLMDGLSTMTASAPLVSGGMLNLRALSLTSGEELIKNQNTDISVVIPTVGTPDQAMRLWMPAQGTSGTGNNSTPVTQWDSAINSSFTVTSSGYSFYLPKFGWANCDRLYSIPGTKTTVSVRVTKNDGATNEKVVFVYKNINTLINVTTKSAPNTWQSYTNSIPVGSVADIMYLAKAPNGKVLFKLINANTFSAGQIIELAAEEVSASVVDAYLSSL